MKSLPLFSLMVAVCFFMPVAANTGTSAPGAAGDPGACLSGENALATAPPCFAWAVPVLRSQAGVGPQAPGLDIKRISVESDDVSRHAELILYPLKPADDTFVPLTAKEPASAVPPFRVSVALATGLIGLATIRRRLVR